MINETYTTPKELSEVVTELKKIRTSMRWSDLAYLIEDVQHLVEEDNSFQSKLSDLEDEIATVQLEYEDLYEDYKCLKAQLEEGEEDYI